MPIFQLARVERGERQRVDATAGRKDKAVRLVQRGEMKKKMWGWC